MNAESLKIQPRRSLPTVVAISIGYAVVAALASASLGAFDFALPDRASLAWVWIAAPPVAALSFVFVSAFAWNAGLSYRSGVLTVKRFFDLRSRKALNRNVESIRIRNPASRFSIRTSIAVTVRTANGVSIVTFRRFRADDLALLEAAIHRDRHSGE